MNGRLTRRTALGGAFLAGDVLCARRVWSADPPGLVVVVHPQVNVTSLDPQTLEAIYTGSLRLWPGGGTIRVLNLPARSAERALFDRVVLHMTPEQSSQFWILKRIRGDGSPPRQIPTVELMQSVVRSLPGAIGYVPVGGGNEGLRQVARIDGREVLPP